MEGVVGRLPTRRVAVVQFGMVHVVDRSVGIGGRILVHDTLIAANLKEACGEDAKETLPSAEATNNF